MTCRELTGLLLTTTGILGVTWITLVAAFRYSAPLGFLALFALTASIGILIVRHES